MFKVKWPTTLAKFKTAAFTEASNNGKITVTRPLSRKQHLISTKCMKHEGKILSRIFIIIMFNNQYC